MSRRRVVVFVLLQLAIVAALIELTLRFVGPRHDTLRRLLVAPASVERIEDCESLPELMKTTIVGFRPGTPEYGFVLNSRSLRTAEYDRAKPNGVFRVLTFGDSFTWASGGLPHRQHWPTILEDALTAAWESPVEVLRLGVPATGPPFQLRLWQLEGAMLDANAVVVAFFVGNDFVDHRRVADRDLRSSGWRHRLTELSATVRLAVNLRKAVAGVEDERAAGQPETDAQLPPPGTEIPGYDRGGRFAKAKLSEERFLAIGERRMALCHDSKREIFEELLAAAERTLVQFRDEVEATGASFLVMLIPDEYQVSPTLAARICERSGNELLEYDLELPQRRLTEVLSVHGVEVLDLLPAFAELGATSDLYGLRDTHWNHRGNRHAAAILAERMNIGTPDSR